MENANCQDCDTETSRSRQRTAAFRVGAPHSALPDRVHDWRADRPRD